LLFFWPKLLFPAHFGGILTSRFNPLFVCLIVTVISGLACAQTTKAQLEISEQFFTLTGVLNTCGYDAGLQDSLPLRETVRKEIMAAAKASPNAATVRDAICQFWKDHEAPDSANDISKYNSLALEMGDPPGFALKLPDADLPPDASHVQGIISLLQKFYAAAGIHALWQKHQPEYQDLVLRFHDPIADVITQTDLYLKLPFANYPGQQFAVFLEPMLSPSSVDSRNYGSSYFVIVSPNKNDKLRLAEIRHTYLHFVLDPLAQAHGTSLKRLEPILETIQRAPLNRSFKEDIALLVNECLIRAIETRTTIPKTNERGREAYVQRSVEEGFVLTRYFYDSLAEFEKESTGMKTGYGDLLHNIDLIRETKHARGVTFAERAEPEVISASRAASQSSLLDEAERRFAGGDRQTAEKLALQVLQHNNGGEEPGRAAFLLARIASLQGKMEEARTDFEQAVQSSHDPRVLAWSHIYLGRILDIQEQREAAVEHYRLALAAGDPASDTRNAAEKGLAGPYQKPGAPR
jgi:tetratricopeptide (TPR) repeat protein